MQPSIVFTKEFNQGCPRVPAVSCAVPDAQRVTPRWVQESLAAGELQSLALHNNRLIYRPLPYRTPLTAFQELKWVLCVRCQSAECLNILQPCSRPPVTHPSSFDCNSTGRI